MEYLVIDFRSNRFNGHMFNGHVGVGSDGSPTSFKYAELDEGEPFAAIDGQADGMVSEEDGLGLVETTPGTTSSVLRHHAPGHA